MESKHKEKERLSLSWDKREGRETSFPCSFLAFKRISVSNSKRSFGITYCNQMWILKYV